MTLQPPSDVDLMSLTAELVDIPSVSLNEAAIADFVEDRLRRVGGAVLEVARIGDNVCARTSFGRPGRLILAGHIDTVPPNGNERADITGEVLSGLGSVDMKGGDAVFLETARAIATAAADRATAELLRTDVTFVFYVCEEIDRSHSGLLQLEAAEPAWLEADAAILGEPTSALVEAGCQGSLRVVVESRGERAHTARPWMGQNAIHGLGRILQAVSAYEGRRPVIDGCEYREAMQAVRVEGGVANNVVPDYSRLVINHRFAPDRSVEQAYGATTDFLTQAAGDIASSLTFTLEDASEGALPGLSHPLLASLVQASKDAPRAKLGWTDVSFFSARGVPAANFGPGDATLAHSAGEKVSRNELDQAFETLLAVIG